MGRGRSRSGAAGRDPRRAAGARAPVPGAGQAAVRRAHRGGRGRAAMARAARRLRRLVGAARHAAAPGARRRAGGRARLTGARVDVMQKSRPRHAARKRSVRNHRRAHTGIVLLLSAALLLASPVAVLSGEREAPNSGKPKLLLIGIGDSLTHGTMEATNNATNPLHAYLQNIADSLAGVSTLTFSQPLFDNQESRIQPLRIPTNVGVDGADSFSVEGIQYYRRVGAETSYVTDAYLADALLPSNFEDKYDKVFYPINVKLKKKASMVDSAVWLMNQYAGLGRPVVVFWVGNNDSSSAA